MKKADIATQHNGVKITFTGEVAKQSILEMVQRCQNGQCKCMIQEEKDKITEMAVSGEDGNIELLLEGKNINPSEIKRAIKNSPLIN